MKKFLLLTMFLPCTIGWSQDPQWALAFGDEDIDHSESISVDLDGNVVIVGGFRGSVDFDPSDREVFLNNTKELSSVFVQKLNGQGELQWVKAINGDGYIDAFSVATDTIGNIFITGRASGGSTDFDPSETTYYVNSQYVENLFVLKLDGDGNFVWVKTFGSYDGIMGTSIQLDVDNNVFVTGSFLGSVDFDPSKSIAELSSNDGELFLLKLDTEGDFIWSKNMGGYDSDNGRTIAIDHTGNVYMIRSFNEFADFDPSPKGTRYIKTNGWSDIIIQKLDSNGDLVWVKTIGGKMMDYGRSIAVDNFGYIYVTGEFEEVVDFDPSPEVVNVSYSTGSVFVAKMDSNGKLIWVKTIGGGGELDINGSRSIAVNYLGDVYVAGTFQGVWNFQGKSGSEKIKARWRDIFIAKLDSEGNFDSFENYGCGCSPSPNVSEIVLDIKGNLFVSGHFSGTLDFSTSVKQLAPLESKGEKKSPFDKGNSDFFVLKTRY